MSGPMEGVKVVEMGVWVAGPAAGCVLADWGADVIKIEPPGLGDPARSFAKMLGGDLPFNPPFEMDNRGKRSIVLDVTTDEGREIALELMNHFELLLSKLTGMASQTEAPGGQGQAPQKLRRAGPQQHRPLGRRPGQRRAGGLGPVRPGQ